MTKDIEKKNRPKKADLEKVRSELEDRGRILELQVYQMMRKRGWEVNISEPFWDLPPLISEILPAGHQYSGLRLPSDMVDENRYFPFLESPINVPMREIDLVSTKHSASGSRGWLSLLQVGLVVECKSRTDEIWVFVNEVRRQSSQVSRFFDGSLLSIAQTDDDNLSALVDIVRKLQECSHHWHREIIRLSHVGYQVFGNYKQNNVRNSCEQVIGAYDFICAKKAQRTMTSIGQPRSTWQFYPVVVVDAPVVEAIPTGSDVKLEQIPWVTHLYRKEHDNYLIDIVCADYFVAYLEMLEVEMKRFNETIAAIEGASDIPLKEVNFMKTLPSYRHTLRMRRYR